MVKKGVDSLMAMPEKKLQSDKRTHPLDKLMDEFYPGSVIELLEGSLHTDLSAEEFEKELRKRQEYDRRRLRAIKGTIR
jgi:hypothetical protein